MQQYFIKDKAKLNQMVAFSNEQRHHIQNVMRMKEKEIVKIVDCESTPFLAYIHFIDGKAVGECYEVLTKNEEKIEIILIQGMIKKEKWDLLIQKVCELGVSKIIPMISSRSVVRVDSDDTKKIERYNKIALEACEQCKRESIVEVSAPIKFKDIIKYKGDLHLIAYEDANATNNKLKDVLAAHMNAKKIIYVIGSEGGFSNEEVNYLMDNEFLCVSLGKRILRAETAAISVVNTTHYHYD